MQICKNACHIFILTTKSLPIKLTLTDFFKTNTDFEAPPHILNSGRLSPRCVKYDHHSQKNRMGVCVANS